MSAGRRSGHAPASAKSLRRRGPSPGSRKRCTRPANDQAWLEARFAGIAAVLQQSLADNNPAKSLAALDRRLDRMEARLDSLFSDMSVRLGGAWLQLIEEHVKELAAHFEATSRQLARLDAIDGQLHQLTRALDEHVQWSQAQPSGCATTPSRR